MIELLKQLEWRLQITVLACNVAERLEPIPCNLGEQIPSRFGNVYFSWMNKLANSYMEFLSTQIFLRPLPEPYNLKLKKKNLLELQQLLFCPLFFFESFTNDFFQVWLKVKFILKNKWA